MSRIVAALVCLGCTFFACSAYGAAGSLDPAFGNAGIVQTAFGFPVIPTNVMLQSSRDIIVVAGFDNTPAATEAFGVVRYLANGKLDTSFGTHGATFIAFTNFINSPNAAALQADGKIVVVGEASSADGTLSEFAIARLNADGSLDSTFGQGGKVTTNFVGVQQGGVSNPAKIVLVQTDGKILVGGTASVCAKCGTRTALARYNTGGSLLVTSLRRAPLESNCAATLPATVRRSPFWSSAIAFGAPPKIFKSSVPPDPKVGSGTIVAHSIGGTNVFQPDAKYLLTQEANDLFNQRDVDSQLVRLNSTGSVDWAFNNSPFDGSVAALVVQPDGKIISAGSSPTAGAIGVARFNSNGSTDSTFGTGGMVSTSIPNEQVSGTALTLQPDGKVVVIAQALINSTNTVNLVLARYLGQ